MAEATNIVFTALQGYAGAREAVIEATGTAADTITLSAHEYACNTIKGAVGHIKSTGVLFPVPYATNVLTLGAGPAADDVVIRVLYE